MNMRLNKQKQRINQMLNLFCMVLLISCVQSFDFNCEEDCGKYDKSDTTGPSLHKGCVDMEQKNECKQHFGREKKELQKKVLDRVVGGHSSQKPMPWMTMISALGALCGGTLINNEFVLSAAHCICIEGGPCQRKIGDVEKDVPLKIQVRSF